MVRSSNFALTCCSEYSQDLSVIETSKGMDIILEELEHVRRLQKDQLVRGSGAPAKVLVAET